MLGENSLPRVIPELLCADVARSLRFYADALGFQVVYDDPERGAAYVELDGAHLMLQEPAGRMFATGTPSAPLGQGLQLQIACWDAQGLYDAAVAAGTDIPLPLEENWYPVGRDEVGQCHFVVADPDGYLLRFYEDLGQREAEE